MAYLVLVFKMVMINSFQKLIFIYSCRPCILLHAFPLDGEISFFYLFGENLIFFFFLKTWSRHLFLFYFLKGKQNKKEKP